MKRFRSFAAGMTACLLLSGCQSVYLHDEGLKTSTAKAHEALAGATPLKPFDDQLANLEAFAQREDLAVADFWTAARDAHLNGLIAAGDEGIRRRMPGEVSKRYGALVGGVDPERIETLREELIRAREAKARQERQAEGQRDAFLELWHKKNPDPEGEEEAPEEPDLSCKTLILTSADEERRLRQGDEADIRLATLIATCRAFDREGGKADKALMALTAGGGLVARTADELKAAEAETEEQLSERARALKLAIEKAKEFDEQTSSQAQLAKLRDDIRDVLDNAGAATQLAGWKKADALVHGLLRAEICDAPDDAIDEATRTAAECDKVEDNSTTGKAQAGWAVLKAVAQLQDAGAEQRRSVNWLAGAKAIIAAEKADAALRLAQKSATAAMLRDKLDAQIREAAALAGAQLWLQPRGRLVGAPAMNNCWAAARAPQRRANYNCAFAAYSDAWNQGRVPAEVLAFRPIQIDREFAVRRARSAAEKQYALAIAGAATLKQYGEGGIMPESVAQLLLDLTTIGAIRLED